MRWIGKKHEWHRWFAWYPFTIVSRATGQEATVWWEHIARKQVQGNYFPYYIYHPDPDYKGDE
jgi:hypothetical protein